MTCDKNAVISIILPLATINLILIFAHTNWLCSTMDSMRVSEALDPGSIPGKATS